MRRTTTIWTAVRASACLVAVGAALLAAVPGEAATADDTAVTSDTAPTANASHITPGSWSAGQTESRSSFQCGVNQVMVARAHDHDENGATRYRCASVGWARASVTVAVEAWGPWIRESDGTTSWCGANRVLVGREHLGDENGTTRYQCGVLRLGSAQLALGAPVTTDDITESSSSYSCPGDRVMVGRKHRGDENGQTNYACSAIWWDLESAPLSPKGMAGPYRESASRFECADGELMTSRKHQGDENGSTWYQCSDVTIGGQRATTMTSTWTTGVRESTADVSCPEHTFITGREHSGDENGTTTYRCSQLAVQGRPVVRTIATGLSPYLFESRSDFVCPPGTAMTRRWHTGDENGLTRHDCAAPAIAGNSAVNTHISSAVRAAVGVPAAPGAQADRITMGIDDDHFLHLDIGGEGWTTAYGIESGFRSAVNVNDRTTHSQTGQAIPNLVRVQDWATSPGYPVTDRSVDYLTMQGAPMTDRNASEMARVLRADGRIGLWIDPGELVDGVRVEQRIRALAAALGKPVDWSCADEFRGNAGNPKTCIG